MVVHESPVSLVEKACSEYLVTPDWTTNMQICDIVNRSPQWTGDVLHAVCKRVTSRKLQAQKMSLSLLETLMKNCGPAVHRVVAERELSHVVKAAKKGVSVERPTALIILAAGDGVVFKIVYSR